MATCFGYFVFITVVENTFSAGYVKMEATLLRVATVVSSECSG